CISFAPAGLPCKQFAIPRSAAFANLNFAERVLLAATRVTALHFVPPRHSIDKFLLNKESSHEPPNRNRTGNPGNRRNFHNPRSIFAGLGTVGPQSRETAEQVCERALQRRNPFRRYAVPGGADWHRSQDRKGAG